MTYSQRKFFVIFFTISTYPLLRGYLISGIVLKFLLMLLCFTTAYEIRHASCHFIHVGSKAQRN